MIGSGLPNESLNYDVPSSMKALVDAVTAVKERVAIEKLALCNAPSWAGVSNETSAKSRMPGPAIDTLVSASSAAGLPNAGPNATELKLRAAWL